MDHDINKKLFPSISVITPTLNAALVLGDGLRSIREQNYPQEKIEIIIADGGSTDATLEIAKKYGAKIVQNKLKTAEAGKAEGLKFATGELVALIDSDNILPTKDWFNEMVAPLITDSSIVGSEPWSYTYRKEGGFIERYSALIGMNDPIIMFMGNYDRLNILTGKWTEVDLELVDHPTWLELNLEKGKKVPTIGANGTVFRSSFLKQIDIGDYLFDIDVLYFELEKKGLVKFAKTKNGIIHTFCESSIKKFARKQKRRVLDYFFYKSLSLRKVEWADTGNFKAILIFILYTLCIIPMIFDSIKGFLRKPDLAVWIFHPIACFITLYQYASVVLMNKFTSQKEFNRDNWKQ